MPKISNPLARTADRAHAPVLSAVALVCAVALVAAPAIPAPARLIVLPALLFVPGWSLLRALDRTGAWERSWSVVVPMSLAVTILAALGLDVVGLRLDATTLGITLGALTGLFVVLGLLRRPGPINTPVPQRPKGTNGHPDKHVRGAHTS